VHYGPVLALALLVGFLFGFLGSMPIAGPTAVVVVAKGLDDKFWPGVYIAVGAAVAESVYAFMAFWGLTSVLSRFPILLPASRLFGCVLLIALGSYFAGRKKKDEQRPRDETDRLGYQNVLFGLSMTAVNPTLLVTWTAAVSAAHSTGLLRVHATDAFPFAGGVALGIVSWFVMLLRLLSRFRSKVNTSTLDRVIRGVGIFLIVVGVALAIRVVVTWRTGA
jgi:threonine/homoserine/homoserine lactone efflux protein